MPGDKRAVVIFQPNMEQLLSQAKQSHIQVLGKSAAKD